MNNISFINVNLNQTDINNDSWKNYSAPFREISMGPGRFMVFPVNLRPVGRNRTKVIFSDRVKASSLVFGGFCCTFTLISSTTPVSCLVNFYQILSFGQIFRLLSSSDPSSNLICPVSRVLQWPTVLRVNWANGQTERTTWHM